MSSLYIKSIVWGQQLNSGLQNVISLEKLETSLCRVMHKLFRYAQDDNNVICYYSLWSLLPTPCCRATGRKRH